MTKDQIAAIEDRFKIETPITAPELIAEAAVDPDDIVWAEADISTSANDFHLMGETSSYGSIHLVHLLKSLISHVSQSSTSHLLQLLGSIFKFSLDFKVENKKTLKSKRLENSYLYF